MATIAIIRDIPIERDRDNPFFSRNAAIGKSRTARRTAKAKGISIPCDTCMK